MKKRVLFAILMMLISVSAYSHDIEVVNSDGVTIYYNWANNYTELSVTYCGSYYDSYRDRYTGKVVIPEYVTYNGKDYLVTSIGDEAFFGCTGLTSISLGDVKSIGSSAFEGCTGLTSIDLGNVRSIGGYAFSGCTGLTSIDDFYNVRSIGDYVFSGCTGLTSIYLANVRSIGDGAFQYCTGLTSINLGDVKSIGSSAFEGCTGLTSINLGDVKSIGGYAFSGTPWYDNQPDGLVYAGSVAYKYKGTMPDGTTISIKDGTIVIADDAFSGCTGLTSIEIPNSVTSIGSSAFYCCSVLTSVTIPNSVTSFGEYAFYYCYSLTSVTIPNSVTSIGKYAFNLCSGLTSVTVERETPVRIDFYTFTSQADATLYVPYGCKAAYEAADYWKEFKEIVEMAPESIGITDISQLDNAIYIEPVEARCGTQVTLSVKMKNSMAVQTIQFDLYLPDGVSVIANDDGELITASKERIRKYQYFNSSIQPDGALRLLAQATTTNISAGDGEICMVTVGVPEDMEEGEYPILFKEMRIVGKDNTNHSPSPNLIQTKLVVSSYIPGDANGDGEIDAIDFNIIGNYILGFGQSQFNEKAADINGDGEVDAIDFNMVANYILYGSYGGASASREFIVEDDKDPS